MSSSQFKVSRRIGENVWSHKKLTPKQTNVVWKVRRKATRKQSDFATKLHQTTKLSLVYGNLPIRKIQHSRTYNYLNKEKSLLLNLESRLDVILVRANFCSTLFSARQFISHGFCCVNLKRVTLPAFALSNGDIISISQDYFECMQSIIRQNIKQNRVLRTKSTHLEVNFKTLHVVLLYEPSQIHFPYSIELDLI